MSILQKKIRGPRPCLVHTKNQKVFKIPRHIESFNTYMHETLNIDENKN